MGCFYLIFALVVVPLFFEHPSGLVDWVQYIVQSIFQGVALPLLGYVSKKVGDSQEKVINETHDAVIEELVVVKAEMVLMKQELLLAKKERAATQTLIAELHNHHLGNT